MQRKRLSGLLLTGSACLLIAGCGGGGGSSGGDEDSDSTQVIEPPQDAPRRVSSPPPGYPQMDGTAAANYAGGAEFRRIEPSSSAEASLMQKVGAQPACSGISDPDCISANPYTLQNIHYAHTATLDDGSKVRGEGTLIAVVDIGFRTSHQELNGKNIDVYPSLAVDDHGTAVAAVAAGRANGVGMMGVAPDADLHLTSWGNFADSGGTISDFDQFLNHLADATDDAAAHGAVVQNNSWGFRPETAADEELQGYNSSNADSYAEYLSGGNPSRQANWQNLFDAYDDFQNTGVIVYSNSNDRALGDVSDWAALPLFVPELEEAWITVSSALFSVDENTGEILDADLLSAPCGSAAEFCVTGDGTVYAPNASSNTSYWNWTGTSFAAPQVSGQIALMAQAFPDLSPAELTKRLFVTANRAWDDFQDSIEGQQDFGSGIIRDYSSLYGHGVPDMKAALEPVGGLSIASGGNVATAERTDVDGGIATGGPVVGNAVAKAIAGRKVMVVDALGTDFYLPGSALGTSASSGAPTANARNLTQNVDRVSDAFAYMEMESEAATTLHDAAVPKLFFSQTHANLGGETAFSQLFPLGGKDYLQFAGTMEQTGEAGTAAFSMSRLTVRGGFATELSLSFGHSAGSFFGSDATGPFVDAENAESLAAGFAVSRAISDSWSVGAYAEMGSGFVGENPAALVDYGAFAYASGGLTARRRGLFTARDVLDLYAGVRPAAFAGEAEVSLPVGRDKDGTIRYDNIAVDLSESDVPVRLGFVYRNRTERDFDLSFGFNTDFVAGGAPEPVYSVSVGLEKTF